ncbi:hydroxyisourate hydrolase [Gammaproteobacteria bacterium AS21]
MAHGYLTTHILDTANGCPAANVTIELYKLGSSRQLLVTTITNSDGRTDKPLLDKSQFSTGRYELVFYVAEYFSAKGTQTDPIPFLDEVVLRFGIAQGEEHYHVPLLVSPYSYSTYRGS